MGFFWLRFGLKSKFKTWVTYFQESGGYFKNVLSSNLSSEGSDLSQNFRLKYFWEFQPMELEFLKIPKTMFHLGHFLNMLRPTMLAKVDLSWNSRLKSLREHLQPLVLWVSSVRERVAEGESYALSLSFHSLSKHYRIDKHKAGPREYKFAIEDGPRFDSLMDVRIYLVHQSRGDSVLPLF